MKNTLEAWIFSLSLYKVSFHFPLTTFIQYIGCCVYYCFSQTSTVATSTCLFWWHLEILYPGQYFEILMEIIRIGIFQYGVHANTNTNTVFCRDLSVQPWTQSLYFSICSSPLQRLMHAVRTTIWHRTTWEEARIHNLYVYKHCLPSI